MKNPPKTAVNTQHFNEENPQPTPQRQTIVNLLHTQGPLTRQKLVEITGYTRATVSTLVTQLQECNALLATETQKTSGRGRPTQLLALNRDCPQYIGVAIQKLRGTATIHNVIHEPLLSIEVPNPSGIISLEILEKTVRELSVSARQHGLNLHHLQAVGCAFPGLLPNQRLNVLPNTDSRELAYAFEAFIEDWFGYKPIIDGTARVAALAELRHRPALTDCLYFRVSDGVAMTQVVASNLVTGTYRLAGEIGHITIDPNGIPCFCGKQGCLETIISNPALCRQSNVPSTYVLLQEWSAGNPQVRTLLTQAMRIAGAELAHAALITDPGSIIVSWNLTQQIPELFTILEESIRNGLLPALRRSIQIEPAILPEVTSCSRGAAYLAAMK
ncbi:ROK family protein [Gleimia sp. 6138-11-ORH1]|uniref:ROK family transcriptional regulator n=1 Tax=Gleimia sp. 6138-11-ORH1 TaxID=2973937 RepID=UPI0021694993|nr:ROK family transcriptional regulator [Gleimia sp. 6138-11-ORH1]MCS4484797.1 ROK family protein [Gleimia sp. 6138-11-ORH1]